MGPEQVLPLGFNVDLRVIPMKVYSNIPRYQELEPY